MQAFDETIDIVVAGSGGGSMAAALVMRDAGNSVLILEKTDLIGGTTATTSNAGTRRMTAGCAILFTQRRKRSERSTRAHFTRCR